MDINHVRDPLDVFTDLCNDSARQLSASNFHSTFEMFWELVEVSQLPVGVVGKKKPSYAAALTQGPRSDASGITSSSGPSQANVLAPLYQQSPLTTSLVSSRSGYSAPPATPELLHPPFYYPGIPSPREAASLPRHSPTSSVTSSCSRPSQGKGGQREPGYHQSPYSTPFNTPSLEQLTSYPPSSDQRASASLSTCANFQPSPVQVSSTSSTCQCHSTKETRLCLWKWWP